MRNKDAGTGGEALQDLLKKVREIDVDALSAGSGKARIPILGRFANTFERFSARYQKVATSIERIIDALERSRMALLKDMTVLDKMYELNLDYLKQLDVYIAAGEQALQELHAVKIPALEAEVAASSDVMAAQRLADLQQAATRFERRIHDLKLTRMIAIQTAPQIRLIQGNDQNLVEKIQSSILTTIPLWKNQIVIAISLYRQQKAVELQKQVTDTTNELLAKNAELLREGSAKVGREVERGVVDVETLQKVNADLIATLEETIQIQEEGRDPPRRGRGRDRAPAGGAPAEAARAPVPGAPDRRGSRRPQAADRLLSRRRAAERLPAGGARPALERPLDLRRDPAAVEVAGLRLHLLVVDPGGVHAPGIEGDVVADRLEARAWARGSTRRRRGPRARRRRGRSSSPRPLNSQKVRRRLGRRNSLRTSSGGM